MGDSYHILNGDSLKEQFPSGLDGRIIVARECLVDGDADGQDLEAFYMQRAKYIASLHDDLSVDSYYREAVPEFEKIMNIPAGATVYLWFEDDLFCQVNFWFVCWMLNEYTREATVFLVRPNDKHPYSFGHLGLDELRKAFDNKISIACLEEIARLWILYRDQDTDELQKVAEGLTERYPFIQAAVDAHIARLPRKGFLGKPRETLLEIMKETGTNDFPTIFREFTKREGIYGFGDLQVKRMIDQIKESLNTRS